MSRLMDYYFDTTYFEEDTKIEKENRYDNVVGLMDDLLIELYHPQGDLDLLFVDELLRKMAIEMSLYIPNYCPTIKREPRRI
jgi:hypothetical protein